MDIILQALKIIGYGISVIILLFTMECSMYLIPSFFCQFDDDITEGISFYIRGMVSSTIILTGIYLIGPNDPSKFRNFLIGWTIIQIFHIPLFIKLITLGVKKLSNKDSYNKNAKIYESIK